MERKSYEATMAVSQGMSACLVLVSGAGFVKDCRLECFTFDNKRIRLGMLAVWLLHKTTSCILVTHHETSPIKSKRMNHECV